VFVSQIESFRNFKLHAKDKAACQRVDISQNGARHLSLSPTTERLLCTVIADPVLALPTYSLFTADLQYTRDTLQ
jgi:hypothetical protein